MPDNVEYYTRLKYLQELDYLRVYVEDKIKYIDDKYDKLKDIYDEELDKFMRDLRGDLHVIKYHFESYLSHGTFLPGKRKKIFPSMGTCSRR